MIVSWLKESRAWLGVHVRLLALHLPGVIGVASYDMRRVHLLHVPVVLCELEHLWTTQALSIRLDTVWTSVSPFVHPTGDGGACAGAVQL